MEKRFRNYDQAELDREYDNRAKVADAARHLEHYIEASITARAQLNAQLNQVFDAVSGQSLDVFRPHDAGEQALAINIFIHGGYWKALSKNEFSFVALGLSVPGAITVVVDYALIPDVSMAELVRQCRAACAWVWRNAADLGGDPQRIYVSGHSAGGHLTAMMMATDWAAFAADLPAQLIQGGCGISGLYDLEPIRLSFLNNELHLDEATAAAYSPVTLACHAHGSLLLPVGALEGPEYARQSQDLAAAWDRPGAVDIMAGEDHFSIVSQLEYADAALTRAILRQMGLG